MRKAIIFLLLGILAASSASASTPWTELFSYSDGNLSTVSGGSWAIHSGTGTDVQVVSNEAVVSSTAAPDMNYQFRTQAEATATDVIYASFKLKITGTQTAAGTYFAHFMNTGTFFAGRVFAALGSSPTTYKIGINTTSGVPAFWPTELTKDVYYNIAVRYDAGTGISTLWVNPTPGDWTTTGLNGPATTIGTLVSGFALRQAGGYGTATIDDILVDLTSGVVPTTNSSFGSVKSLFR